MATNTLRRWLRPVKRALMFPPITRAMRRSKWDRRWRRHARFGWQVDEVAPELLTAVESGWLRHGMYVLDVGCGAGECSAWLARHGFRVLGVDVSPTAIERATRLEVDSLSFAVVDVTAPGALAGMTFDVLVDRGCLHGVPDKLRPTYASNISSWTETGGKFLLAMHTGSGQDVDVRTRQVRKLLGSTFAIEGTDTIDVMWRQDGKALAGVAFRLRRR